MQNRNRSAESSRSARHARRCRCRISSSASAAAWGCYYSCQEPQDQPDKDGRVKTEEWPVALSVDITVQFQRLEEHDAADPNQPQRPLPQDAIVHGLIFARQ